MTWVRACSTHSTEENTYKILVEDSEGEKQCEGSSIGRSAVP